METEPEVLVVGAGPAGLVTGLLLAEQGFYPTIIDAASGTTTHSYACALHPYSLSLLSRFGLMRELLEWGNRIDTVAFYDGWARKAELKLSNLDLEFPYLLVLPQSALEWILESALKRVEGIQVNWRRQLLDVQVTD
jgi:2-polyprenyl-6-methoxyphenol hydroxylase-like FAD-dependent oxidoreductase